jgi:O-6-methylguanine DNA methyltransferase
MPKASKESNFTEKVYAAVCKIKKGSVATYKGIATIIGQPKACRAVGNALNKNTSPLVPCHRIVRSDGSIGGFRHGTEKKVKLLKSEGIRIEKGKIV